MGKNQQSPRQDSATREIKLGGTKGQGTRGTQSSTGKKESISNPEGPQSTANGKMKSPNDKAPLTSKTNIKSRDIMPTESFDNRIFKKKQEGNEVMEQPQGEN